MAGKKSVSTPKAPAAIGPYSQSISAQGLLFVSGQLPIDPATGALVQTDIEAAAHQVFTNLRAIAEAAGVTLDHAVKTTVFLTDLADFKAVNAVYAQYFEAPFPARSAVQVAALPLGGTIEAEAIFTLEG